MKKVFFTSLFALILASCSETDPIVEEEVVEEVVSLSNFLLKTNKFATEDTNNLYTFYTVNDSSLQRQEMAHVRGYFWNEFYPEVKKVAVFTKKGANWILDDEVQKSIYSDRASYLEIDDFLADSILFTVELDTIILFEKYASPRLGALTSQLSTDEVFIDLREPKNPGFAISDNSAHRYLWFLTNQKGETILGVETADPEFKFYNVVKTLATLHPEYTAPSIQSNSDYSISILGLDTNRKAFFMAEKGFSN